MKPKVGYLNWSTKLTNVCDLVTKLTKLEWPSEKILKLESEMKEGTFTGYRKKRIIINTMSNFMSNDTGKYIDKLPK